MVETIQVDASENYGACLKDTVFSKPKLKGRQRPSGYVELFGIDKQGNKEFLGRHNLVVYQAREWVAQRCTNINNPAAPEPDFEDYFIAWLGLGSGGCPAEDPLNPIAPENDQTNLFSEIPINASDVNDADFRGGYYYKKYFDDVTFEQDTDNDNRWLIAKITTTIATDDVVDDTWVNEAALFLAPNNTGGSTGPFYLFSITTFPTIVKDSSRELLIVWRLYF